MMRDIAEFNPRAVPMTEAKKNMIEMSRSPIDSWIMEHYELLLLGIHKDKLEEQCPKGLKIKIFVGTIKDKCKLETRANGQKYYVLKKELRKHYKPDDEDE